MAAGAGFVIVLVLLVGLAIPVCIWLLTESETDDNPVMDREAAERDARSDANRTTEHSPDDDPWSHDGQ